MVLQLDITVVDGKSVSVGFTYVYESSGLYLNIFNLFKNTVNKSGGAIYCEKGKVIIEKGNILDNYANKHEGGLFSHSCQITLDNVTLSNNSIN